MDKRKSNKLNKWLLAAVVVLAVLLVLWLTVFEYMGAVEQGEVERTGEEIEQVSGVSAVDTLAVDNEL